MSGPVTEFSYFAARVGLDLLNQTKPEGQILVKAAETALKQSGATRVYHGLEIENPNNVWLFLDWDSYEDHVKYRSSQTVTLAHLSAADLTASAQLDPSFGSPLPIGAEVTDSLGRTHALVAETLKPILDFSRGFVKHVSLKPYPPVQVLDKEKSGVTEVLSAYFPSDVDDATRETAEARFEEFIEKSLKSSPDFKGVSYGWSIEGDVPIRGDENSVGRLLVAFIGWPSVEAHMKFRGSPEFTDHINIIRNIPGIIKLGAFHVSCRSKTVADLK